MGPPAGDGNLVPIKSRNSLPGEEAEPQMEGELPILNLTHLGSFHFISYSVTSLKTWTEILACASEV